MGAVVTFQEQFDQQSIIGAIKKGQFYASQGPEFLDLRVMDGKVYVETSNVKNIKFISSNAHGYNAFDHKGGFIHSASYSIKEHETYVRIEIIDEFGNRAWSNPIFIDELKNDTK